jgi:hypothetical protein
LVNLSTHTNIASCPWLVGVKPTMKPMLAHSHFSLRISKSCPKWIHIQMYVHIIYMKVVHCILKANYTKLVINGNYVITYDLWLFIFLFEQNFVS